MAAFESGNVVRLTSPLKLAGWDVTLAAGNRGTVTPPTSSGQAEAAEAANLVAVTFELGPTVWVPEDQLALEE